MQIGHGFHIRRRLFSRRVYALGNHYFFRILRPNGGVIYTEQRDPRPRRLLTFACNHSRRTRNGKVASTLGKLLEDTAGEVLSAVLQRSL